MTDHRNLCSPPPIQQCLSRRQLLRRTGMGIGTLALGPLLGPSSMARASTSLRNSAAATKPPHFRPHAKHVIHVFLNGGMSQVDTFDPKPELARRAGQRLPISLQTERQTGAALPSPFKFSRYGQSGIEVSEIFPHLAQCVDEMAVIRSMHAELPNHELSLMLMNCGDQRLVRPSVGAWVTYGMGSENQNLPGFVVLCPSGMPVGGAENWRSAFLPGIFQGTRVFTDRVEGEPIFDHLRNTKMSISEQRSQLDLIQELNRQHAAAHADDPALESRIESLELAYRMQMEATDAFEISNEPEHIRRLYGEGPQNQQLLIARRLVERGVRFVQTWHGSEQPWDSHSNIDTEHRKVARECDQGLAALIIDLKQRGLLDETLILCSGEFGRTPSVEMDQGGLGAGLGRDHNHWGFSLWMAGGGIKGGTVHGATDDFGFKAVEKAVSIHDLHATMLHLLGFDHERLTYKYAGRDFRLTDVEGFVIKEVLA
ncbi:MAG TPA: DUF1501 domain-containing protein [Lacipirellulaceae bacterium]|nr:DUF1501 domain-containing protein [Lacipirellulaceae bacterium]HMP07005.1 DUF1501 domain-containing protein [Lacipirellulaceae bacterium]